ncbi:MAG: porin family protein [Pseudomonadales bacterium]|nr:porin family protein [Pseudomonadales bacterium]
MKRVLLALFCALSISYGSILPAAEAPAKWAIGVAVGDSELKFDGETFGEGAKSLRLILDRRLSSQLSLSYGYTYIDDYDLHSLGLGLTAYSPPSPGLRFFTRIGADYHQAEDDFDSSKVHERGLTASFGTLIVLSGDVGLTLEYQQRFFMRYSKEEYGGSYPKVSAIMLGLGASF